MIKIKNRRMIIPESDRRIAMRGDAMANVLTFAVPTSEVGGVFGEDGVSAYLKLVLPEVGGGDVGGERAVTDKKAVPIALTPGGECDGCYVWKWQITADITAFPGYIPAQLCLCRGTNFAEAEARASIDGGAVFWNSEISYFYTGESLGVKEYEPSCAEISAIEALLISVGEEASRAVEAKERAEEFCSMAEDSAERADEAMRSAVLSSGSASDYAERAKVSADESRANADSASESCGRIVMLEGSIGASVESAGKSRDEARVYAESAKTASDGVTVCKAEIERIGKEAENASASAVSSARDGKEYAENAKASADEAEANMSLSSAYAQNAEVYCGRAKGYAESASERAVHAGSQAENARSFAENAELYADEAKRHADRAEEATGANINLDGYVKTTDYATDEVGGVIKAMGHDAASIFPSRTSSRYLSVSEDGALQMTSAYPYEVASSYSDSLAPLTNDLKYAVAAISTHKQMSDDYDVESKQCVNLGNLSKGDLPASYDAVKNYVDGEVGGLYEDIDVAVSDFENEIESDYDVGISDKEIVGMSGKVIIKCCGEVITASLRISGSTTVKVNDRTLTVSDAPYSFYREEMANDIEINLQMGGVKFDEFKVRRFRNTLTPLQVKNAISAEVSEFDGKISAKLDEDVVFGDDEEEFLWTDFSCGYDESKCRVSGDEMSISEWASPVTVHCKGRTLAFHLTCYSNCTVTVNGVNVLENECAWGFDFPMTKMESDIVFSGSASNLMFGNMRRRAVGGVVGDFVEKKVSERPKKSELSLGVADDGLIYLFVAGEPQGTGIDPAGL